MTADQVDAVGERFARTYYAALVSRPTAPAKLRAFYGCRSEHLYLARGRPDTIARGPDEVERLAARMGYGQCSVRVRSVETIRVRADRFVVLAIGEMVHPGCLPEGRKFVQSSVVRWDGAQNDEFRVVGTVFMFDDAIDDDSYEPTSPPPVVYDDVTENELVEPLADPNTVSASVCVAGLPGKFRDEDLWNEFDRFGKVVGAEMVVNPKRKSRSKKFRHGIVWYDIVGTADSVAQSGTVTLTNGHVVTVERTVSERPRHNVC